MAVSNIAKVSAAVAATGALVAGGVYVASRPSTPATNEMVHDDFVVDVETTEILRRADTSDASLPIIDARRMTTESSSAAEASVAPASLGDSLSVFSPLVEPVVNMNGSFGGFDGGSSGGADASRDWGGNPTVIDRAGNVSTLPDHFVADPNHPVYDTSQSARTAVQNERDIADSGRTQRGTGPASSGSSPSSGGRGDTTGTGGTSGTTGARSGSGGGTSGGTSYNLDPCYKYGGAPQGQNLYTAQTCNSGFYWSGAEDPVPIWIYDCGDPSTHPNCDDGATAAGGGSEFACLWQVCRKGKSAIWDPQTKKCGCDDP